MMDDRQVEETIAQLDRLTASCTGCGLCSESCATFQFSGWEHESPRGRIHLASQFIHGRIAPSSPALTTFDRCLGCTACEPVCPHEVAYGKIRQTVQKLRTELNPKMTSAMDVKAYNSWISLAYRIGNHFWRRFGAKWISGPLMSVASHGSFSKKINRPVLGKPVLAFCCLQDLFQHDVIAQALAFMQRIGHPLAIDKKQPCCGAIFERLIHGGDESVAYRRERQKAAALQQKSKAAFLKWLPQDCFFLAEGCRCFSSQNDPQKGNLYALIDQILKDRKLRLYFPEPREVFYQPYCRSSQAKDDPVRRLLDQIEGLKLKEVEHPSACCGGYCGEPLLHPEYSQLLAGKKIAALPDHAVLIVTSPDCRGAFGSHPDCQQMTILYPIQLLAQASMSM